jgi:cellulose synthase operon protein C
MVRVQGNRRWSGWLRQRAAVLLLPVGLVGLLVVAVAAGWVGWLIGHPGQAWAWIRQRWFAASALGVVVAVVGVIVAVAMPRWQQRRNEQLAAAERHRQEQQEHQRRTRQHQQAAIAAQAAWEQRCRSLLASWPLLAVEEVNPYDIGVFYSRRAERARPGQGDRPPYVPRVLDEQLAGLLASQPLVLVKGQSRAGKSRTAFEVAARELPGWRLLVPKDRAALAALAELDRLPGEGERVLVWLDDLDEYLAVEGTRGLDAGLLGRFAICDPPMKVLATIRLEEYGRLIETPGELSRSVRELLNRFEPGALTLPVGFDTPAEQATIAALYPGERVIGGLAEYLAAAHELVNRLEVGEASVPEGAGLVVAGGDPPPVRPQRSIRRRAGLKRPVSREDLEALLPLYLKQLRPLAPVVGEGEMDRGLGWAMEPVGRTAALLVPDPDSLSGTFRVADPIVDYMERRTNRRLVEPAVWQHLLAQVSSEEAMDLGFAAITRGERRAAETAWRQVVASGHPNFAPRAAFNLGHLLGTLIAEQGDVEGARAAFQEAIDSGHADATTRAQKALRELGPCDRQV